MNSERIEWIFHRVGGEDFIERGLRISYRFHMEILGFHRSGYEGFIEWIYN